MILKLNPGNQDYFKKYLCESFVCYVNARGCKTPVLLNTDIDMVKNELEFASWKKWHEIKGIYDYKKDDLYVFDGYVLHNDVNSKLSLPSFIPLIITDNILKISLLGKEFKNITQDHINNLLKIVKKSNNIKRFYLERSFNLDICKPLD